MLWNYYLIAVTIGFSIETFVLSGISVLACFWFHGNFDLKYLYTLYKFKWVGKKFWMLIFLLLLNIICFVEIDLLCSLPWDQSTPIGYFYKISFDTLVGVTYLVSNGALLVLFVSICLFHQAFSKMFEHSLRKLGESGGDHNDEELLCQLIQFHISVKKWVYLTVFSHILPF